eukprot:SAG11_NODE_1285_length_5300_cov_1.629494_1_plen_177_part_00
MQHCSPCIRTSKGSRQCPSVSPAHREITISCMQTWFLCVVSIGLCTVGVAAIRTFGGHTDVGLLCAAFSALGALALSQQHQGAIQREGGFRWPGLVHLILAPAVLAYVVTHHTCDVLFAQHCAVIHGTNVCNRLQWQHSHSWVGLIAMQLSPSAERVGEKAVFRSILSFHPRRLPP